MNERAVTDYRVVSSRMLDDLEATVQKLIGDGWEPLGGLSTYFVPAFNIGTEHPILPHAQFAQAMVRRR